MKVCVFGLGHLGCVTAACLSQLGHVVIGLDHDKALVEGLNEYRAPVVEPNLGDMIRSGRAKETLYFTTDVAEAVRDAEVVWVTFDTPVDEHDVADVGGVLKQIKGLFGQIRDDSLIIVSSQLPVGSTRELIGVCRAWGGKNRFAYSPENLRRGSGVETFLKPGRIIVGLESGDDVERVMNLLRPITGHVIFMSIESAEMTKHAINGFLAASIAFINEIADLCGTVGANARDVERGLKTEPRIGPKAYLTPGGAFTGGTLGRDLAYLSAMGRKLHVPTLVINSVIKNNRYHLETP